MRARNRALEPLASNNIESLVNSVNSLSKTPIKLDIQNICLISTDTWKTYEL